MRSFRTALITLAVFHVGIAITPQEAVNKAITYFQQQCVAQQKLMPELLTALKLNDLSRSTTAYTAARPPYEQIETHAHVFPDIDAAIDARPDAFEFGEDSELFQGFHRIERDLYRDQRMTNSYATAVKLNDSVNALCDVLADVSKFDPPTIWEGILALVYEVPAKKISSEEETWSDLSLMIYRNNFQGVYSQAEPFFETDAASAESVRMVKEKYEDIQKVLNEIDPENDFFTTKGNARSYASVTIAERKRISDASYAFAAALETLRDEVAPLEGGEEGEEEEESGGLDAMMYANETAEGVAYFFTKCQEQLRLLDGLEMAVKERDLAKARVAYGVARPPYEQIETLAPSFPDLDKAIDARPYAYDMGEANAEWKGFHLVERLLYRDDDLEGAEAALVTVRGSVEALCETLKDEAEESPFSAERSWEGLLALAFEVPAKKISSEEETWSDLSIMIFRENVLGVQSQVEPFLKRLPKELADKVRMSYEATLGYLLNVVDSGNDVTGTNFVKYSAVPVWERKTISDHFYEYGRVLRMAYDALLKA